MTKPVLRDLSGRLTIGAGYDGIGPTVTDQAGAVVGIYLDDTTPSLEHWIGVAVHMYAAPRRVFVGVAPGTPRLRHPQPAALGPANASVVNMQEWYPFGQPGVPWRLWGLPPKCEGYIVQRDFAWPGGVPPRKWQFRLLLWQVRLRRPKYIWTY